MFLEPDFFLNIYIHRPIIHKHVKYQTYGTKRQICLIRIKVEVSLVVAKNRK
jgi:hypothetical protein